MTSPIPEFDICIVGGSVAGSAAAITLTGLGLTVAVIERESFFRDKARGEGIHPWGIDEAEDLGLLDGLQRAGAHPLPVWQTYVNRAPLEPFLWADESARGHAEHGAFHPRLQESMLADARNAGATVLRPASLVGIDRAGTKVVVSINQRGRVVELHCRYVVGADGTRSKTRSLAEIGVQQDPHHHWFAGVLIDRLTGDQDAAHAALIPGGRFFILPQGEERARLYAALMPDRVGPIQADRSGRALIELVAGHLPDGVLDKAQPAGPQGIFSNADTWPDRVAADRIVLIGDAAGTNDPSVGNGISQALRDVRELRDLIQAIGLSQATLDRFAGRRSQYYGTLRAYASWMAQLWLEEGPEADERRANFRAAREEDPDAGGFNVITALGPRDLVANEAGRGRFFGESRGEVSGFSL